MARLTCKLVHPKQVLDPANDEYIDKLVITHLVSPRQVRHCSAWVARLVHINKVFSVEEGKLARVGVEVELHLGRKISLVPLTRGLKRVMGHGWQMVLGNESGLLAA